LDDKLDMLLVMNLFLQVINGTVRWNGDATCLPSIWHQSLVIGSQKVGGQRVGHGSVEEGIVERVEKGYCKVGKGTVIEGGKGVIGCGVANIN
jgi:hypothetical protein